MDRAALGNCEILRQVKLASGVFFLLFQLSCPVYFSPTSLVARCYSLKSTDNSLSCYFNSLSSKIYCAKPYPLRKSGRETERQRERHKETERWGRDIRQGVCCVTKLNPFALPGALCQQRKPVVHRSSCGDTRTKESFK